MQEPTQGGDEVRAGINDARSGKSNADGNNAQHNTPKQAEKPNEPFYYPHEAGFNFLSPDVAGNSDDDGFESSRFGRARVRPLAYWSSERMKRSEFGSDAMKIEKGSKEGDLLNQPQKKAKSNAKWRRRSSLGKRSPKNNEKSSQRARRKSTEKLSPQRKMDRSDSEMTEEAGIQNLAAVAAMAGATAAKGGEDHAVHAESSRSKVTPKRNINSSTKMSSPRNKVTRQSRQTKASKDSLDQGKPSELQAPIMDSIPRVKGVPESIMAELAATAPSERPKRCGYCNSCLNPARKKACEAIRALGVNPPIPRGKNRVALLGKEGAKKTLPRVLAVDSKQIGSPLPFATSSPVLAAASTSIEGQRQTRHKNIEEQEVVPEDWTEEQVQALHHAWLELPPNANNFWQKVAERVPGKTASECFSKIYEKHPTPKARRSGSSRDTTARRSKGKVDQKQGKKSRKSKLGTKTAIRKQQREELRKESKASESNDDAILPENQKERYIDQLLRQRRGKALGGLVHTLKSKPSRESRIGAIQSSVQDIQAVIAAANQSHQSDPTDNDSDYYWSESD